MISVADARGWGRKVLCGTQYAARETDMLLGYVLKHDFAWLISHNDELLDETQEQLFRELLARRNAGEPVAYILGEKEFFSLCFLVSPAVLIPRPETEILVERALGCLSETNYSHVLDIGCGSGAIAVSIAYYAKPTCVVVASDISEDALAIARANAKRFLCDSSIHFVHSDLLEEFEGEKIKYPLIVANLPYVGKEEVLPPDVQEYEPSLALRGGVDGFDIVRKLLQQIADGFKRATVMLEFGEAHATLLLHEAQKLGYRNINTFSDLRGVERFASLDWSVTELEGEGDA